MHVYCTPVHRSGFSLVELLAAFAVLLVVTSVTVARLNYRAELHQTRCAYGLKETGLAMRQFANDNAGHFPAQVARTFGGARDAAAQGQILAVFVALAEYQARPAHWRCPADTRSVAPTLSRATVENLSYFINADAGQSGTPEALLGDRDLTAAGTGHTGSNWVSGVHRLSAGGGALEWSGVQHRDAGNLALTDGSVKLTPAPALPAAFGPSARLLFPQ